MVECYLIALWHFTSERSAQLSIYHLLESNQVLLTQTVAHGFLYATVQDSPSPFSYRVYQKVRGVGLAMWLTTKHMSFLVHQPAS